MVIKNIERNDVEFIHKTFGCTPVASIDNLTADKLGTASMAEEITMNDGSKIFQIV